MLNPTFGLPCSWKRMMTLLNLLILAPAEKLRLLETQTWGTSNRERSYSLKGKGTTDAMFHYSAVQTHCSFCNTRWPTTAPSKLGVLYGFWSTWITRYSSLDFLDIVGWITLLFKNLVMTKSWKSECEISVFQCRLLCFPLHACLPTADSLNCCVDFMQSILVVTIMYDEVASYKISPYLSSTFDVKIHGTCWYRFSTNEYIFQLLNKV